jgi:hypothetical protein
LLLRAYLFDLLTTPFDLIPQLRQEIRILIYSCRRAYFERDFLDR